MSKIKFRFAPKLRTEIRSGLLPKGESTDSNIIEAILEYQRITSNLSGLRQLAFELEVPFELIDKTTVNCLLYTSQGKRGCAATKFCSLIIILQKMFGSKSVLFRGNPHPMDMLEGDPNELEAFRNEVRSEFIAANATHMNQPIGKDVKGLRIIPTLHAHLDWIEKKQIELYGKKDAVPKNIYRDWYKANSSGFFMFLKGNEIIGHITLLPFKEEFFAAYRKGTIIETDLRGNAIWSENERDKVTLIYVESYMLDDRSPDFATIKIRGKFLELAQEVADIERIESVYAMNATDKGTNAILNFGFKEHPESDKNRTDKHKMYYASLPVLIKAVQEEAVRLAPKNTRAAIRWLDRVIDLVNESNLSNSSAAKLNQISEQLQREVCDQNPSAEKMRQTLALLDFEANLLSLQLPDGREKLELLIYDISILKR